MNRFAIPLALAVISAVGALSAGESFAKTKAAAAPAKAADPSCKQTRWDLKGAGTKTIVDGGVDRVWRVSVGGVPPKASVVLEYTRSNGTKGEVGMPSGYATLVEGASVRMILQAPGLASGVAIAGTINAQC
ncbi:hypothetical protein K32_43320 [Kaistia sp. 32K]|uniref:hypothetical protein n=1 Tax=Kaistia sp. 32K TaxID=2795690 RepID=UPI001915136A|nr:hypothetical protein [Kaistia sp. 32K]BCP55715.1 hypothetical protein K32_43320 [Kaistia sp. 32K]